MASSVQELINSFGANRHQDVIDAIDYDHFSALENPVAAKILAASYFKIGDYVRSLSLLSQIESCFLDDVEYLSLYGACLRRHGDLDLARLQFERALMIDANQPNVQNNFANLLIDIGDLDEAEKILNNLLAVDSSYSDASTNLQRLLEKRQAKNRSVAPSISGSSWSPADPLLLAFSNEEVQRTVPDKIRSKKQRKQKSELSNFLSTGKDYQIANDKLKLAQQAVNDKRYDFALQLCSQVNSSFRNSSAVYECVSDAYIAKSLFNQAEICLLHAIQMGATSFKLFVNLVSLACMRGDFDLAQYYFECSSAIDPDHTALDHLRDQIVKGRNSNATQPFRFDQPWATPAKTR